MTNPCLSAALEELAAAGIRDPVIARGSKHPQVRWTTPRGETRMYAVPGSSSDWRSPENVRRDIRRVLRADGMLETPQPKVAPVRQLSRLDLLERRLAEVERRLGVSSGAAGGS
jgi:hypothetical protein